MTRCGACGADNPDGARFCNACGERLGVSGAGPIAAGSGERRVVTMLFCDVRGSTAMAEELDAEDWTDVMNEAFAHLIEPVVRHEGTVARLMGDAILAFFGAPTAHEDDPQRAVMAGLEIVSSIAALREKVARERGLDLNVRVGINTGAVVVGDVGSELKQEYSAMGDAVNVAARMEQTAEPGHRPDHRGHLPARRRPLRGRAAGRCGAQRETTSRRVLSGARSPGRSVDRSGGPAHGRPARRTREGDGGHPRGVRPGARRAGIGPAPRRRSRDRQEPADRGGQRDLGGDGTGGRSAMGLLGLRALRHDAALRAIPTTDEGAGERQGVGSRRDRAGQDRRSDGVDRPGGMGRAERTGRASAAGRRAGGRSPIWRARSSKARPPSSSWARPWRRAADG